MIKLDLPIYYDTGKKTVLIGKNWARSNAHFYTQNKVKKHYHELVANKLKEFEPIVGEFKVHFTYYYKNRNSDGSNVVHKIEEFFLDAIQEIGLVVNDNVQFHLGSSWDVGGLDKDNPRVEIIIRPLED